MNVKTYSEKERRCNASFLSAGPYWHAYTSGKETPLLFSCTQDFAFAMNVVAQASNEFKGVTILAFEILNNHFHFVLSAEESEILEFWNYCRRRIGRFFPSAKGIDLSLRQIEVLSSLRNCIIYTNRNGYVADPSYTPFSYPWGTGRCYFLDAPSGVKFSEMKFDDRRRILRSRFPGLPLFFLTGMEGRMLRPLGIAFITALFASTLVALTLTPVLCSFLLGSEKSDKAGKEPALVRWLQKIYNVALEWVLTHKKLTLGSVAALFAVALALFCSFGSSFLPAFNEGSFTINVSTLPGVSLEESDNVGRRAEMLLLSVPEIKTVARKTGRAELDEHALGANVSEIEAPFELSDRPKKAVVEEIRHKLGTLPGVNVEIGQPISHRIDAMLSGTRANIAIKLFGTDLNKMFEIGNQIKTEISAIPGVVDLNVEQQVERPQLQIVPKREMLAKYGVTPSEFTDMVEVYLAGRTVSRVYEGNRVFDLTVKADDDSRSTIEAIRDMPVDVVGGKVPFSQIAEIRSAAGPNTINRENVARKIVISANVSDGDLQGAVNRIRKTINDNVPLPEGYHVEYGGQFESAQSATRTLLVTSLMAILVIFLLLYGQFKNVRQASAVLLNLPLALIGGVFAIFFADGIISIPAIIGFISLFGIATRNGMLLIDRYNELRQSGLSLHDAVMRGSLDRLNPILMTALTSALALIPLALGGDLPGNEIQSPMAKVLLGGLLTSTMLNGFIVPVVYILISKKRNEQTI